jgi:hypothetical protein
MEDLEVSDGRAHVQCILRARHDCNLCVGLVLLAV